jgi:hypothetical protein
MARGVHAPVLVRPDRTGNHTLIPLGGDPRVLGGHRLAADQREAYDKRRQSCENRGHMLELL